MERQGRALITSNQGSVDFTVIASEGLEGLPESVSTVQLKLPRRPAVARIIWFYLRSGRLIRRHRGDADLVHSCGAITTARVDVATVHLCQAAVSRGASGYRRGWRRINSAAARAAGRWTERRSYRGDRVGTLVAVSPVVDSELATFYPDVVRTTIANGVDAENFRRTAREARDDAGFLRVIMVTGDFALKGVDTVIEALALARNAHLSVVGAGDVTELEAIARRLGVLDRLEFTGFVDDVAPLYADCDVVVCASHYESFGLYLVEAALAGCALVSNRVGVAEQLVGPDRGGLLVERSPAAYADALNALDADRPRLRSMGEYARQAAEAFSIEAMATGYADLYRSLRARA